MTVSDDPELDDRIQQYLATSHRNTPSDWQDEGVWNPGKFFEFVLQFLNWIFVILQIEFRSFSLKRFVHFGIEL